ncbi:sensor histidine kinase [Microbacterium sp. A196]|uniref:sensor histidine kinase n=1 Tax=Microbacterium sp. A196 TaxID=3457320 RepID=UPI003FCFB684
MTPFSMPSNRGYFGDARCRSIWQWQLLIALSVVMIGLGVALLTPMRYGDWCFSVGMILVVVLTVGSLAVPWHRINASGVLILPILNVFAIAFITIGDTPVAAYLWVIPVTWVASYYSSAAMVTVLLLVGALRIVILIEDGISPERTINTVMLVVTLGIVAIITRVAVRRNRSTRQLLSDQAGRLARSVLRVNEQKARNKRLLDSLDIGVARLTEDGLVEVSNKAFHRIYSVVSTSQFHPGRVVEYRARRGESVPPNETAMMRAARGELFENEIVWLFGFDGAWRAVKATARVLGPEQGDDGLLLIVEDVTESIDPYAIDDAKRRSISHELRNPLTAVLGHLDLVLEREDLPGAARAQLEVVERAGERMQRLIDQVLEAPQARDDDPVHDFDLTALARDSTEAFAPTAEAAGATIVVKLDEPLIARGDAFRLRQVIDNVIGNAIKYAPHSGKVAVRTYVSELGEVALQVIDNGIGIAAEDIPRIFERDFRTDAARASGIPGTGLGLSISRAIIESQGGRFEVISDLGQGTAVTLTLPTPLNSPHERMPD